MDERIHLYRYELHNYGSTDEWDIWRRSRSSLELECFAVVKETPQGYWISHCWCDSKEPQKLVEDCNPFSGKQRWVSKTARKRYAYPTKEEALESYIARKKRQISILKAQQANAERGLRMAEDMLKGISDEIVFEEDGVVVSNL